MSPLELLGALIERERRLLRVSEYAVSEVRTRSHSRTVGSLARESWNDHTELAATLFVDSRRGRGQASFVVSGRRDAELRESIALAVAQAQASIGPDWRLPAPAAPARVRVAAPAIERDLGAFVAAQAAELQQRGSQAGRLLVGCVTAGVRDVYAINSSGFANRYTATRVALAAELELEHTRPAITVHARRGADLMLERRIEDLTAADGEPAASLQAGRYDVVLSADALAHGGGFGLFGALAAQAQSRLVRLGLSRHRPGQALSSDTRGDAITIYSDGTLDYGLHSAPFAELGAPVRRFPLVREGGAADVALDLREAGLTGRPPNGGVRNLDVAPGKHSAQALLARDQRDVLSIDRLSWLRGDDRGNFACAAASARLGDQPVTGGVVRGNLFDLLGRARLSPIVVTRGAYRGPERIRFDDVMVVP